MGRNHAVVAHSPAGSDAPFPVSATFGIPWQRCEGKSPIVPTHTFPAAPEHVDHSDGVMHGPAVGIYLGTSLDIVMDSRSRRRVTVIMVQECADQAYVVLAGFVPRLGPLIPLNGPGPVPVHLFDGAHVGPRERVRWPKARHPFDLVHLGCGGGVGATVGFKQVKIESVCLIYE